MQHLRRAYNQNPGVISALLRRHSPWNTIPSPSSCISIPSSSKIHTTVPRNGMFDSVRNKMSELRQESQDGREQKAFETQMKYLSDDKRAIDGNVYIETIDDLKAASGLSGFREHLPWVSNNPTLADFKREQKILKSLTEHERRNPGRVGIAMKKRIARELETDLNQVEALLDRVCIMRDVQKWILNLKEKKKFVPTSSEELQLMISSPGSGFKRTRHFKKRLFPSPGVKVKKGAKKW